MAVGGRGVGGGGGRVAGGGRGGGGGGGGGGGALGGPWRGLTPVSSLNHRPIDLGITELFRETPSRVDPPEPCQDPLPLISHFLSLFLSLTHTHTHTYAHIHTHTHKIHRQYPGTNEDTQMTPISRLSSLIFILFAVLPTEHTVLV